MRQPSAADSQRDKQFINTFVVDDDVDDDDVGEREKKKKRRITKRSKE